MKLAYTAYEGFGEVTSGVIEAADPSTASDDAASQGTLCLGDQRADGDGGHQDGLATQAAAVRRPPGEESGSVHLRQLYVLTSSGMPLLGALIALERQAGFGLWRDVIADLRARVEQGASLSEAMQDHSSHFDAIYCSLIAAGESSGCLQDMLNRLAMLKQKQLKNAQHRCRRDDLSSHARGSRPPRSSRCF